MARIRMPENYPVHARRAAIWRKRLSYHRTSCGSFVHDDPVIEDKIVNVPRGSGWSLWFDMHGVPCRSQLMAILYEHNVADPTVFTVTPGLFAFATYRQAAEHVDAIDLENVVLGLDIIWLKEQDGSFVWIDPWAIEREVLGFSYERSPLCAGHLKDVRFIAEVLPWGKDDGEVDCHGVSSS
jgi:hypothetical protein